MRFAGPTTTQIGPNYALYTRKSELDALPSVNCTEQKALAYKEFAKCDQLTHSQHPSADIIAVKLGKRPNISVAFAEIGERQATVSDRRKARSERSPPPPSSVEKN